MAGNDSEVVVLDKVKSISSVTCHETCDETTRQCSNDVLQQDSVQSSSPLTSSLTELSTEQHGLIEEPIKESEEISDTNPVPIISDSSVISIGICRICHDGPSLEALISPCRCLGSLGLMHQSCLERWLGASNRNNCEICGHKFLTERRVQPFKNWLRNPTRPSHRRNLICDLICFLLLTPLAVSGVWLCVSGAVHYSETVGSNWEAIGLMMLSLFLITIYLIWCLVAWRFHLRVFRDWQKINQIVRIINFQPSSSVVTVGDLHASLPTSVIYVYDSTYLQSQPPRLVQRDNQIQPWSWEELEVFGGDPVGNSNTEDPTRLIVDSKPTSEEDTLPTPDTADVMLVQEYSCSSSPSSEDCVWRYKPVIETHEDEAAVIPLEPSAEVIDEEPNVPLCLVTLTAMAEPYLADLRIKESQGGPEEISLPDSQQDIKI